MTIPETAGVGKYFSPMDECARMNCDKTAVALLTFSATDAKAWLYDLEQPDPSGGIALCRKHANATVVPMSWQLVDARDPAWPGQVGSQPEVPAMAPSSAEQLLGPAPVASAPAHESNPLPSDVTSTEREFAGLHRDLPVTPQPYSEPQLATARAAGRTADSDLLVDLGEPSRPDPSLFELPLSDIPAVTPHPKYSDAKA